MLLLEGAASRPPRPPLHPLRHLKHPGRLLPPKVGMRAYSPDGGGIVIGVLVPETHMHMRAHVHTRTHLHNYLPGGSMGVTGYVMACNPSYSCIA